MSKIYNEVKNELEKRALDIIMNGNHYTEKLIYSVDNNNVKLKTIPKRLRKMINGMFIVVEQFIENQKRTIYFLVKKYSEEAELLTISNGENIRILK